MFNLVKIFEILIPIEEDDNFDHLAQSAEAEATKKLIK